MNCIPRLDAIAVVQIAVAAILGLVITTWLGFNGWTVFFLTIVAGAAAFFTKDYLAPANNFWRHTPTAVTLGVAVILAIISGMGVPFADWLSVITLATLIGLPAGRILSKFIVR